MKSKPDNLSDLRLFAVEEIFTGSIKGHKIATQTFVETFTPDLISEKKDANVGASGKPIQERHVCNQALRGSGISLLAGTKNILIAQSANPN